MIRNAAVYCTAIEEIVYYGSDFASVKVLSLFLSHLMPKLRSVSAQFGDEGGLCGNLTVPGILAAIASNVEAVSISCRELGEGVFHTFAIANKNLKRIHLKLNRSGAEGQVDHAQRAVDAAVSLIQDVSLCEMLEEIYIRDDYLCSRSQQISEACFALRGRNVDIFVGGIQYSPQ